MEFIRDDKTSIEENSVIKEFFNSYRSQDVIVADRHSKEYETVDFNGKQICTNPERIGWEHIFFRKVITQDKVPYTVNLTLQRDVYSLTNRKRLIIDDFSVLTPEKHHQLVLSLDGMNGSVWLYDILDIFDEKRIITPEKAYYDRLYNKSLIDVINNHQWSEIDGGLERLPRLSDELFIIGNPSTSESSFDISFGTILYQLVNYRQLNSDKMAKDDLLKLDQLIYKLRDSELLKLDINDSKCTLMVWPSNDYFVKSSERRENSHSSEILSTTNGHFKEESNTLNKVIRKIKRMK